MTGATLQPSAVPLRSTKRLARANANETSQAADHTTLNTSGGAEDSRAWAPEAAMRVMPTTSAIPARTAISAPASD